MIPPPARRGLPLWVSAGIAAIVAVAVAIPIGLNLAHHDGTQTTNTAAPPPPTSSSSPAPAPPTAPPPAGPPSGLSADEAALWSSLRMGGVQAQSCASFPAGETDVPGVVAALACPLGDTSFSQPIWYRKFADACSMDGYMTLRANEITTSGSGSCAAGQEYDGGWNSNGASMGRMVCFYEPANGVSYYKIAWAFNATSTVAIIKDPQARVVWNWWQYNSGQFSGS